VKLLLFDVDGTLILSGGAGVRGVNRAFLALHGVRDAMASCRPAGKTDPAIFREVALRTLGRDLESGEMRAVAEAYLEALGEELRDPPGYRVMPGVGTLLERLAGDERFVLGLATGNLERGARLKLGPANLNRYFATGGFGSDEEDRALLVKTAIRRASADLRETLAPEDVIVIGDTPHDVHAARAAGARCVAVATGSTPAEELARHGADAVLTDLSDADAFLAWLERDA
jgi:phosphoglycolate phosphatase